MSAVLILATGGVAWGDDPPCVPSSEPVPLSEKANAALRAALNSVPKKNAASALDSQFMIKVTNVDVKGRVTAETVSPELSGQSLSKTYDLLSLTSGHGSWYAVLNDAPATSFDEAMAILSKEGKNLSKDEKLLYLSMLGDRLGAGYEASGLKSRDLNATFQNLRDNGTSGGICGSIHEYLKRAAQALGFEVPGLNSGLQNGEGHFIAFFKDPATGHFYSQNYSRIIDTGKTTEQGAVDVATQVLAPLTTASAVESKPGVFHIFIPSTARYVEQMLASGTHMSQKNGSLLSVQAGNIDRQVSFQTQTDLGGGLKAKGFALHSEYDAKEGRYELEAVGVAVEKEKNFGSALNDVVKDVKVAGRVYGGGLRMTAPDIFSGTPNSRSSAFGGAEIKGSARIDEVTGRVVLEGKTLDFKGYGHGTAQGDVRTGANWKPGASPLSVDVERLIQGSPKDSSYFNPGMKTEYDRVSVVLDTRGAENKPYLVVNGSVYALDGVTANTATGLRTQLKGVIPEGARGDFVVVADASKIVRNPANDPFYDTPLSTNYGVTWRKAVNRALEVGAGYEVRRNRMNSVFMDDTSMSPGPAIPGVNDLDVGKRKMSTVWLKAVW